MTLQEFYDKTGGDYEEVLDRLRKPERIQKYLKLFEEDDNYDKLRSAVRAKDNKAAFEASHNLKGACLNLGLEDLRQAASTICEEYRNGNPGPDVEKQLADVTDAYMQAMVCIKELA